MVLYGCSLTIRETQRNVKEGKEMSDREKLLRYAEQLLEKLDMRKLSLAVVFLRRLGE